MMLVLYCMGLIAAFFIGVLLTCIVLNEEE